MVLGKNAGRSSGKIVQKGETKPKRTKQVTEKSGEGTG